MNSIRLLLQPPVKQLPYGLCTDCGEEPLSCRIPGRSSSLKPGQACTFQMKQSTPSALQMYCSHFKKNPGIHRCVHQVPQRDRPSKLAVSLYAAGVCSAASSSSPNRFKSIHAPRQWPGPCGPKPQRPWALRYEHPRRKRSNISKSCRAVEKPPWAVAFQLMLPSTFVITGIRDGSYCRYSSLRNGSWMRCSPGRTNK